MNTPASSSAPRFDSNRAWQEASGAVLANRDMLIALAGVFLVLPAFAISVLNPPPEPPKGADMKAILEIVGVYFQTAWPGYLLVGLINTIGTMAILALFGHASRPTVGQAITQGLTTTPVAIVVQIVQGFLLTGAIMLPAALFGMAGSPGMTILGMLIGAGLAIYLAVRLCLANAVIAIEGLRNPITALQRSFTLTGANVGRLLLFFVLLVLAFLISIQLIQLLIGLLAELLIGGEGAVMIAALVGSVLSAVMTVYLLACTAAAYRQLSGPTAMQTVAGKFE